MNETEGLVSLIRQKSSPLIPVKAELSPAWEALIPGAGSAASSGIRAFIFDLYGTLFVSGAGEIGAANEAFGGPNPAVLNPAVLNPPWPNPAAPEAQALRDPALLSMKRYFHGEVTAFHKKAKAAGRAFPEVRVEEIWAGYDGPVPESWGQALSVRERAVLYELAVNPVYP
ncbi:MAG: hypothetical protein LBP29_01545, partial [Treponema sp.]|nr:hypothetical protein [Treponema sp.]